QVVHRGVEVGTTAAQRTRHVDRAHRTIGRVGPYDVAFYVGAGFFLVAAVVIAVMIRDKPENLIEGDEHAARVPIAV
ncbi:hypothetical protein ACWDNR_26190, partial [Gordonia aichiensis]